MINFVSSTDYLLIFTVSLFGLHPCVPICTGGCFFFSTPAQILHGETCSTCQSWPPRGTSSMMRSTSGGGTVWVLSSTTCLATVCWMPGGWWKWPRNGKLCLSVSTVWPDPFRRPSESNLYSFFLFFFFLYWAGIFHPLGTRYQNIPAKTLEHKRHTHLITGQSQ